MDGKGAWRDNVFVERLWRSVKYEEVYLRAYDSVAEARASIGRFWTFTIASELIRAWAPAPRSKPISTKCPWLGRHEFSPPGLAIHSSRARPSLREAPTPAKHNRQQFHLADDDLCPDIPGHRSLPYFYFAAPNS
jgi:hypothetical protein